MRVTQSMLSGNMLRNLSSSYNKMGTLESQLTTSKKVNRPSDDPVVAMRGMNYRFQVDKVEQYKRNIGEAHNWLDNTDQALDQTGSILQRTQELMTNVASDTLTNDDRKKVLEEIKQLREALQDIANSKVGDKYLFNGTKTGEPLYNKNGVAPDYTNGFADFGGTTTPVDIEVFDSITLQVNLNGKELFSDIDTMFGEIETAINDKESNLDKFLSYIQGATDDVLEARAVVGARQNRAELMENRLEIQEVSTIKQMSENEDVDYERVITDMIAQESVHRAALSVGARIIQPSLMDFLR